MANKEKMVKYRGKLVKAIDMTPTWESLLPLIFDSIESKNPERADPIKKEVTRMAKALDRYNELSKEGLFTKEEVKEIYKMFRQESGSIEPDRFNDWLDENFTQENGFNNAKGV
jgi:hypothetical protein